MSDVNKYAKYLIKNGYDTNKNSYDGNMKLQKLLVFANLINIAVYGEPLYDTPILAFKNGCVIEPIRLRYKNDYNAFYSESMSFDPVFSEREQKTIDLAVDLFGALSARELSEINHNFDFWKKAFNNSETPTGFREKSASVVSLKDMADEIDKIRKVIDARVRTEKDRQNKEIVNGITFYYDPENIQWTDELFDRIETFSEIADDTAYTVNLENGNLVIY